MNALLLRVLLLLWLAVAIVFPAMAQDYVYVNTRNLILRDMPEKTYTVIDILNVPTKLKVVPYDDGYKNNKAITDKYYRVLLSYKDDDGYNVSSYGWVMKQYVVKHLSAITCPGVDTAVETDHIPVHLIPYSGGKEHNPNRYNYLQFPYPEFKGGEKVLKDIRTREYHKGPHGGCYYISERGKKVYVDKKLCK